MARLAVVLLVTLVVAPAATSTRQPLGFLWPTGVAVEPDGTLLVVENGNGQVDRIDPARGTRSVVARIDRAYAVALAPSGATYVSSPRGVWSIVVGKPARLVAHVADAGPLAAAKNGDVIVAAGNEIDRMRPGGSTRTLALDVTLDGPHGLAVAHDGTLLVSDTGHGRILAVDAAGHMTLFARVGDPRGIAVARDGTILVVDASAKRVLRLDSRGRRLGYVGAKLGDPYDIALATDGGIYVVDTAVVGTVKRIAPGGRTTAIRGP